MVRFHLTHYMEECAAFADHPSLFTVTFQEPPEPIKVPTSKWLVNDYGKVIMSRLDHVKSSITSKFGNILKLDLTRMVGAWYFHQAHYLLWHWDYVHAMEYIVNNAWCAYCLWFSDTLAMSRALHSGCPLLVTHQCPDWPRRPWSGVYAVRPEKQVPAGWGCSSGAAVCRLRLLYREGAEQAADKV